MLHSSVPVSIMCTRFSQALIELSMLGSGLLSGWISSVHELRACLRNPPTSPSTILARGFAHIVRSISSMCHKTVSRLMTDEWWDDHIISIQLKRMRWIIMHESLFHAFQVCVCRDLEKIARLWSKYYNRVHILVVSLFLTKLNLQSTVQMSYI